MNTKPYDDNCYFIEYVVYTFNIPWNEKTCKAMYDLEDVHFDFEEWIENYIDLNKIKLPFPFDFFNVIFSYCYTEKGIVQIKTCKNFKVCGPKIMNVLSNMILESKEENFESSSIEEASSQASEVILEPQKKIIPTDFEDDLYFNPIDIDAEYELFGNPIEEFK